MKGDACPTRTEDSESSCRVRFIKGARYHRQSGEHLETGDCPWAARRNWFIDISGSDVPAFDSSAQISHSLSSGKILRGAAGRAERPIFDHRRFSIRCLLTAEFVLPVDVVLL
jgi:hypothetical protein